MNRLDSISDISTSRTERNCNQDKHNQAKLVNNLTEAGPGNLGVQANDSPLQSHELIETTKHTTQGEQIFKVFQN